MRALIGQRDGWGSRCTYCAAPLVIVGCWHPHGIGAYVVLGCLACHATYNGGKP